MTNYREILRLKKIGFGNIVLSYSCSRNIASKVLKRADELNLSWPLPEEQTNSVLEDLRYPKESSCALKKRLPNLDYIHKEILRHGVNKKLLWTEYSEECPLNNEEPLMYSRFCYYIQQDEQKRRATMHINCKPVNGRVSVEC